MSCVIHTTYFSGTLRRRSLRANLVGSATRARNEINDADTDLQSASSITGPTEMLGVTMRAPASKHPNPDGSALYSILLFQVIALHIRELAVPSADTVTHLVDEIKHNINLGSTRGTSTGAAAT